MLLNNLKLSKFIESYFMWIAEKIGTTIIWQPCVAHSITNILSIDYNVVSRGAWCWICIVVRSRHSIHVNQTVLSLYRRMVICFRRVGPWLLIWSRPFLLYWRIKVLIFQFDYYLRWTFFSFIGASVIEQWSLGVRFNLPLLLRLS